MNTEWNELKTNIQGACNTLESSGWHSILCPMCGGGSDRRITGGFLLEDTTIIYKCFRGKCDSDCGMELGEFISNKFRDLVGKLGIQIGMKLRTARRKVLGWEEEELDSSLYTKHHYPTIKVPEFWLPASEGDYPSITDPLLDRCCNISDIHYIDSGRYQGLAGLVHKWGNRTVGLSVIGDYVFQIDGEDHMMYTVGGLLDYTLPVYLVEGEVDAMSFPNAVSVKGYQIKPEQAYLLRNRDVVMIPEKSNRFIEQFEAYGWKMCIPNWDADDLNEAVVKYGIFNVAEMIKEQTFDSVLKAEMEYRLWKNRGYR